MSEALKCPSCGSGSLYRNGLRYLTDGSSTQRWLCRVCSLRFCEVETRAVFREDKNSTDAGGKVLQSPNQTGGDISPQLTANSTGKVIEYAWWLKKNGRSDSTIEGRIKLLKILEKRGANLYDPETVKEVIAKQPWCNGRKNNAVDAYSSFLKMVGGKWEPPAYKKIRKLPFIPKETEIDQLIAGCSPRMAAFLQLLKETGARCGEAWRLSWNDIDFESKVVNIAPEKGSNPRAIALSKKLISMLQTLPKNYGEWVFSYPKMPVNHHADHFSQQRKRIAYKTRNPRLLKVHFHTLRHWKATMEYHRTRDILHVKQLLGHRRIENTLKYVQLAEELFKDQVEYVSKVAKTQGEACALIDAGFDFVCDFNGNKLFRKQKR